MGWLLLSDLVRTLKKPWRLIRFGFRSYSAKHWCRVIVFPLFVTKQLDRWKEDRERESYCLSAGLPSTLVDEPDLAQLFDDLNDLLL